MTVEPEVTYAEGDRVLVRFVNGITQERSWKPGEYVWTLNLAHVRLHHVKVDGIIYEVRDHEVKHV